MLYMISIWLISPKKAILETCIWLVSLKKGIYESISACLNILRLKMSENDKELELHPDIKIMEEPKLEKNEFIVDIGGILTKDREKFPALGDLIMYKIAHVIQQTLLYGPNGMAEDNEKEEGLLISVKVYQTYEKWEAKYRVETKLHYE